MRDIKFRAWDKDNDQMIYDFGLTPSDYFPYQLPDDNCESPEDPANYSYFDNAELMQYTGLKDKNGKEIYEGDIAKHPKGDVAHVVFIDGRFTLQDTTHPKYTYAIADVEWEVIGNVHENGDLL